MSLSEELQAQNFQACEQAKRIREDEKRALAQSRMKTDEFKLLARLRNGVETIPSLLKNRYGVNRMPVHGTVRCKFYFGCKVAALNFKKLFRFRKGSGHYALNPVLG